MIQITAESLSKKYIHELIFKDLSRSFEQGASYAITGPNGSGKTTILRVLAGVTPPSSGNLRWVDQGKVVDPDDYYRHLTFMSPYLELIEEFTLKEFLKFHFKLKRPTRPFKLSEFVDFAYLGNSLDKQIMNFSSGMKQRLKLALAFQSETPIVFLDEPGSNLDERGFNWYKEHLDKFLSDRLLFIASNQLREYESCKYVINVIDLK